MVERKHISRYLNLDITFLKSVKKLLKDRLDPTNKTDHTMDFEMANWSPKLNSTTDPLLMIPPQHNIIDPVSIVPGASHNTSVGGTDTLGTIGGGDSSEEVGKTKPSRNNGNFTESNVEKIRESISIRCDEALDVIHARIHENHLLFPCRRENQNHYGQ